MNQGAVYESMNMAATWSLPVLFIIENNQYGMGTDIKRTTNIDLLHKRSLGLGFEGSQVDGMDVLKVYSHGMNIIKNMRKNKKPHLLEAHTYRYKGHSVSDPATYRTKEEVVEYQAKDPINKLENYLLSNKYATESEFSDWNKKIKEEIKLIESSVEKDPYPRPAEAYLDVYVK